jgi:type I restriction enzyme S subunit
MSEWYEVALSDLGQIVTGSTPKAEHDDSWGNSLDFVTPSDQRDGSREVSPARRLSNSGVKHLRSRIVPAGSTCFTCIGATIGKVSLLKIPAITNQQINSLVPRDGKSDSRFIYYLLRYHAKSIAQIASGSATPIINKTRFGQFKVAVPAFSIQVGIGEVLGSLDDKIAVNQQIVNTVLKIARLRYAEVLADLANTGQCRIGDVTDVFDGPHATPKKTNDGPWFLGIASLGQGLLDLEGSAHLSEYDFGRWTRRTAPRAGDVLFSYETRLGVAALMPPGLRACLGRRMALLRPIDDRVGSATLLHAYLADGFQETIRKRAIHGATVDRIPLTDLPSWPITLPVAECRPSVEAKLSVLHQTIDVRQRENRALAGLRDTLLPKLISGELRIRDAELQVAEVI